MEDDYHNIDEEFFPRDLELHDPNSNMHYVTPSNIIMGSYSLVARMEARETGQPVAVKTIEDENVVPKDIKKICAGHSHITDVHGLTKSSHPNPEERKTYLITEWVEGEKLDQWLRSTPPLSEVARVTDQVADAVNYLNHRPRKLVHGDLKPSNIMVDQDGNAQLVDPGFLVKANKPGPPDIKTFYSAPEQQAGQYYFQTDVHGLGGLTYAALSGDMRLFNKQPFLDDKAALIPLKPEYQQAFADHPEEHQALSDALRQSMARHPQDRQATVAELNDQLQAIFDKILK